jgi:hypothetical protein
MSLDEIVALEQQWQIHRLGEGVSEAVADIEPGAMAPTPKSPKRFHRKLRLLCRHRGHLNPEITQ